MIIEQSTPGDGLDVRWRCADGDVVTWHFRTVPADVAAACRDLEAARIDALAEAEIAANLQEIEDAV